ncbi:uncharacterized protein LOC129773937 [Toxorhynchites rutilus septentrionalis]|uniref:uncharacterized protein LOC129773937 n=1 Tax=Toxorhynchites rutilus septentrionalis TaxID=329112 RepID=UPI0024797A5D|nr:uncharacterized protein LOC129773937 [Toxorhynchites rutilus septentrionalis]
MAKVMLPLILMIVGGSWSTYVLSSEASSSDTYRTNSSNSENVLSRKKRFLLFPLNSYLVVTVSGSKTLIIGGPSGNNFIAELDLYYPLPDYRYRISSLRLGEIAMLPTENKEPKATAAPPPPAHEHHDGQELSDTELQQYFKDHPETWTPPGYGKDRSDWFPPSTYNPYPNYSGHSFNYGPYYRNHGNRGYQPYKSELWQTDSNDYIRHTIPRMKRSMHGDDNDDDDDNYVLEEEPDRFNISHHRDWEHFYHYRERRELYHTLENEIGDRFSFPMKSCILRAICEARSFLLPPGKSMIMDIVRIVLSVPLKEELQDEYSTAMREASLDCHGLYGKNCPISILYLILFGKFVP